MKQKIGFLLLADDQQTVLKWQKTLLDVSLRFFTAVDDLPEKVNIEILITDWPEDRLTSILELFDWASGKLGVVRIGQDGSGDIYLPNDVAPRELKLTCQLLSKSVRLKNELNRCQRKLRLQTILSMTDHLTGLLNRRALEIEINQNIVTNPDTIASKSEPTEKYFLGMIDIDRFKQINQQDGFLVGDLVLKTLANSFQETVDRGQLVVRLGGDEFVVVEKVVAKHDDCISMRERFEAMIQQLVNFVEAQIGRKIDLSAGVVIWNPSDHHPTLDDLLKQADLALREAKQNSNPHVICTDMYPI